MDKPGMGIGPFDRTLDRIVSGSNSARRLLTTGELGEERDCPSCGDLVQLREMTNGLRTIRYWSDCTCLLAAGEKDEALSRAAAAVMVQVRDESSMSDLRAIAHLTLDTFDPGRLAGDAAANPHALVVRWLERIQDVPHADDYESGPPACLFLYSAGKGRGKTHLAAGAALWAKQHDRLAAFADEIDYIERYWAASLEEKARLSALPGRKAWLTVLDDLGQRESTPPSLRDAWYDVINPRWLKRGWTIITSNKTLDELLYHGTIGDATYSRLAQMTRGEQVTFNGSDQRLRRRT